MLLNLFFSLTYIFGAFVSDSMVPGDPNSIKSLESEKVESVEKKDKKRNWNLTGRYKGIVGLGMLEYGIFKQLSIGLGGGQFTGESSSSREKAIIPDLYHAQVELTYYLGKEKRYFTSGPIVRSGLHFNYLTSGSFVQSVSVDNETIITRENLKLGPSFYGGYYWSISRFNGSIGVEYFSLGALKTFIPLSFSVGIKF